MAKEIVSLKELTGGLNTFANPKQIGDSELTIANNVNTSVKGTVKVVGGFEDYTDVSSLSIIKDAPITQGGYGLFSYKVDRSITAPGTAGEFSVIACFEKIGSNPRVGLLQEASGPAFATSSTLIDLTTTGCRRNSNDTNAGSADVDSRVQYLVVDGQLVVHGSGPDGLEDNDSFDPQILKFFDAGQRFFQNNGSLDPIVISTDKYEQRKFFVEPPKGGAVYKSSGTNPALVWIATSHDWGINDDKVGLVINQYNQDSQNHIGWGKSLTESQNYTFYASYVYDGTTESMATGIGTAQLGGHESGSQFNDATFLPVVRVRANGTSGASEWDEQITGIRIYYAKTDQDQDIKYQIGHFDVRNYSSSTNVCIQTNTTGHYGYAFLLGDKSGKGSSSWVGRGIYHYETPRIFTHSTSSGIRASTKSTSLRFKTGVILNRKLYVGNISQVSEESPEDKKEYPDRLLKSISNNMRVLPDTEFVDVAIRDGEDIVRLAGIGNMLLQYKQNTLYVISVAGGDEYLAGTYKNMGVRHPNAVVQFEGGVFWANEFGAYIFGGDEAPINLINSKIALSEWSSFITENSIVGYDANNKKFWICGNSSTILDDSGTNPEPEEFYTFNMLTSSWNKHIQTIGEGYYNDGTYSEADAGYNAISNFINYIKPDGSQEFLIHEGKGSASASAKLKKYNDNKLTYLPFKLQTKEFTAVNSHQRKSIYAVYISYIGDTSGKDNNPSGTDYIYPRVKLICRNAGNTTTTTTLEPKSAGLGFTSAADWETAHYVVPAAQKVNTRNAYSVQVAIEPGVGSSAISTNFEVSEVSIILRLKSVK